MRNRNETAVLTVIFPSNLRYWGDLIENIIEQNSSFDLVVVLDGLKEKDFAKVPGILNVHFTKSSGSPFVNRLKGIEFCQKLGFKKIIFQDSDDLMSSERVSVVSKLLDEYPIVCNDLNIMDEIGTIINKNIWKDRIKNRAKISASFLKDKNIVGFGNSGITANIDLSSFDFQKDLKAPDWYFFSILNMKYQTIFTHDVQTYYRQHSENIVGMKDISSASLMKCIDVKIEHFNEMKAFDSGYESLYEQEVYKKKYLSNLINESSRELELPKLGVNRFWWEESNTIL